MRSKRLCSPSSSPHLSLTHSKHLSKKVGKSLEDLSTLRVSKSPLSSEKTERTVSKTKETKSSSGKPYLYRSVSAGYGAKVKISKLS